MPDTANAIVPGGWSIACEVMFYLAFPLLRSRIDTFAKALAALAVSLAVSVAVYAYPYFVTGMSELNREFLFCSIIVQAPAFLFGFVVFYAPRPAALGIAPWAAGLAVIGLAILAVGGPTLSHFYLALPPLALLLWAMAVRHIPMLDSTPLRFLGVISYSLYLFHRLVRDLAAMLIGGIGGPGFALLFPALLCLSALVAGCSYVLVEKPAIRFGRRWASRFLPV